MILKRKLIKIRSAIIPFHLILLWLLMLNALTFQLWAQNQSAISNGAGMVSGGNYTGYLSAGQVGTYLFANGNQIATQGIVLNEISSETEFTFMLSGNLSSAETDNLKSGELLLKSATEALSGPPLSFADVFLILVDTGEIFAQTTTDENGYFMFEKVPYKNFFLTINTPEIPDNPVLLTFESNIFIQEVVVNGEVGTEGITPSVSITPVNGCDPENPDYQAWYRDLDGDGYGDEKVVVNQCSQPVGYSSNSLDCNDNDPYINPDAEDVPGSGIDANCDGIIPCSSINVTAFAGPSDPVEIYNEVAVLATVEADAVESAVWEWGDGETSAGTFVNGSVTGLHTYLEPGVYTVNLKLTNDCGEQFSFTFKYVVIYDSSAGFVTGGGAIRVLPGASADYPDAGGIASFGFVSRYDKNKLKPTGNTSFEFDAAGLNFKSSEYEWLVVAGSYAKFKGKGKINGSGDYQFMISAEDGDLNERNHPDKFRIKIWDDLSGQTVFDNEMSSDLSSEPLTEILEGSIVIHVPKLKNGDLNLDDMEITDSDFVGIYPNPTKGLVNIIQNVSIEDNIKLKVFNNSGTLILEKSFNGSESPMFDMSNQVPGIYMVHLTIGNEQFNKKLIVL